MNFFQQIRDKTCPFRVLAGEREKRDVFSKQNNDNSDRNGVGSSAKMAPTSGSDGDFSENLGTDEFNVHQQRRNFVEHMELMVVDRSNNSRFLENDGTDEFNVHWLGREHYTENMENVDADRSIHYKFKNSKSLMSRRHPGYVIRPLDSLESCVAAQLCKEHENMDEYMYSSLLSPSMPVLRPLLVTDGSRIIRRAIINSSGLSSNDRQDKPRESRRPFDPLGSPDGMILFFMGITIGLFSIIMANKREVDRLSKKIKQRENLVQDLREELEMKEVLTVKELADEASQPQRVDDLSQFNCEPSSLSSKRSDEIAKHDDEKLNDQMMENSNSEPRNTIEAELEAELERLELNLRATSLERVRDYVELDQDLEDAVVQGNIKVNVHIRRTAGESESDDEASTIANNYCEPPYYAVPPVELRLRLHEVIEARLESRIKELETALESSESRLHSLESQRRFTYSEVEFSSTPQSPTYMYQDSDKEEPLFINLAGNALDAYNEGYAEMLSTTNSDKEEAAQGMPPSALAKNGIAERRSRSVLRVQRRTSEEQTSRSLRSSEKGESEDEDNDELDMLLIKRIVERRRSGSNILVHGT